jgi:hypothetical protein
MEWRSFKTQAGRAAGAAKTGRLARAEVRGRSCVGKAVLRF